MIVISIVIIVIITAIVMFIIFYRHNQYNYLIIYYIFKCYLSAERLIFPY